MMTSPFKNRAFIIDHADNSKFEGAGSCVLQPPGIKHREVRHSDNMELIEIVSPADFPTRDEDAP